MIFNINPFLSKILTYFAISTQSHLLQNVSVLSMTILNFSPWLLSYILSTDVWLSFTTSLGAASFLLDLIIKWTIFRVLYGYRNSASLAFLTLLFGIRYWKCLAFSQQTIEVEWFMSDMTFVCRTLNFRQFLILLFTHTCKVYNCHRWPRWCCSGWDWVLCLTYGLLQHFFLLHRLIDYFLKFR